MEPAQIPTEGWRRLRSVEERALHRGVKVEVYGCVTSDGRSILVIESHTGVTASMQRGEVITPLTKPTAEAAWMAARTCVEGARA
jgi:hypothetical protein